MGEASRLLQSCMVRFTFHCMHIIGLINKSNMYKSLKLSLVLEHA